MERLNRFIAWNTGKTLWKLVVEVKANPAIAVICKSPAGATKAQSDVI